MLLVSCEQPVLIAPALTPSSTLSGSSAMKVAKLPLPIPDMAMGRNIPHAGVENSSLVLQL